jgi:hypothetical protein
LSVVEEVERGEGDMLVLRRAAHIEVTLAVIEPRERVAGAIELGKLQLVRRQNRVAALIIIVVTLLASVHGLWSIAVSMRVIFSVSFKCARSTRSTMTVSVAT